ncbi:MAG: hypothetical protein RLZZ297_973 [Chloroflexota bacterium]|jgi:alpha-tubulin suppressor-like RCC1 family protein
MPLRTTIGHILGVILLCSLVAVAVMTPQHPTPATAATAPTKTKTRTKTKTSTRTKTRTATRTLTPSATPVNIAGISLTAGGATTCVILPAGTVRCIGQNSYGTLGYGDTTTRGNTTGTAYIALPNINLGTGAIVRQISMAYEHTCALLTTGAVKCWGAGDFGVLGNADTTTTIGDSSDEMGDTLAAIALPPGRTAVSIAAHRTNACAILDNGALTCWGDSIGNNDNISHGADADSMGANLPIINLGTGRTVTSVDVGDGFVCALLDDATLKCFGYGENGRLGYGSTSTRGVYAGANDMGNNLAALDFGTGVSVSSFALGTGHGCAILSNKTVKCWGSNGHGQLGLGNTNDRGDTSGEMGSALPVVNLGTGHYAVKLALGTEHSCALLENNTVKCWGKNDDGQLGQGTSTDIGDNAGEMGNALATSNFGTGVTVKQIAPGNAHTCVLLNTHAIKCVGWPREGQMGYGDDISYGNSPSNTGDAIPQYAADTANGVLTKTPTKTRTPSKTRTRTKTRTPTPKP